MAKKKKKEKENVSTTSWGIFPPVSNQQYPPLLCPLRHFQRNGFLIIKQITMQKTPTRTRHSISHAASQGKG